MSVESMPPIVDAARGRDADLRAPMFTCTT